MCFSREDRKASPGVGGGEQDELYWAHIPPPLSGTSGTARSQLIGTPASERASSRIRHTIWLMYKLDGNIVTNTSNNLVKVRLKQNVRQQNYNNEKLQKLITCTICVCAGSSRLIDRQNIEKFVLIFLAGKNMIPVNNIFIVNDVSKPRDNPGQTKHCPCFRP